MPQRYSANRLRERQDRALKLGFLQAVPEGHSHILVPNVIKRRAQYQVRNLHDHYRCNAATGRGHHLAARAILDAAD
eukprot:1238797-Karenia_brevis.AAC.1